MTTTMYPTYTCGHTTKMGLNGTREERDHLKKVVDRIASEEICAWCKMQNGAWEPWISWLGETHETTEGAGHSSCLLRD